MEICINRKSRSDGAKCSFYCYLLPSGEIKLTFSAQIKENQGIYVFLISDKVPSIIFNSKSLYISSKCSHRRLVVTFSFLFVWFMCFMCFMCFLCVYYVYMGQVPEIKLMYVDVYV